MNIWDIVLIVVLVGVVAIAARSAFRKDRKRSCCGGSDCSACSQNKM